jgi:hypothetical protein
VAWQNVNRPYVLLPSSAQAVLWADELPGSSNSSSRSGADGNSNNGDNDDGPVSVSSLLAAQGSRDLHGREVHKDLSLSTTHHRHPHHAAVLSPTGNRHSSPQVPSQLPSQRTPKREQLQRVPSVSRYELMHRQLSARQPEEVMEISAAEQWLEKWQGEEQEE